MSVQTDWSRWIFLKPNWSYSKNMVLKNGNLHVGYLKNMWTWLSEKSWRSGAKQYINKSKQYWGVVSEDGLCLNQGSPHLTFVGWQKSKRWEWAFYLRTFKNKLRVSFHCEFSYAFWDYIKSDRIYLRSGYKMRSYDTVNDMSKIYSFGKSKFLWN